MSSPVAERRPSGVVARVSVCVATHERPHVLPRALAGLAAQERAADEIVISDSSRVHDAESLVRSFALQHPSLLISYLRSERNALPWQRWFSFCRTSGDIVLFLDDDVWLAPAALRHAGIGRAEDAVLSAYARRLGTLYLVTHPVARHPRTPGVAPTPYAGSGWRLGITGTWGMAHVLRWMASDRRAYRHDLFRLATLEVARATSAVVRRPWGSVEWQRLAGACYG